MDTNSERTCAFVTRNLYEISLFPLLFQSKLPLCVVFEHVSDGLGRPPARCRQLVSVVRRKRSKEFAGCTRRHHLFEALSIVPLVSF